MKRTLKLMLRRETLRTIANLELVHVVAGNPGVRRIDTGNAGTGCPVAGLFDSGGPVTGCPANTRI